MRGASGLERGLRQAARVAGVARSFQAVDQNQLGDGLAGRALRMDQHLDARFGFVTAWSAPGSAARPSRRRQ